MKTRLWSANFNALSADIDREGHAEYWLKGGYSAGAKRWLRARNLERSGNMPPETFRQVST